MEAPVAAAREAPARERYALVVCDVVPDLLQALPEAERQSLLENLRELVGAARQAGWLVAFSGLRFASGYAGLPHRHRPFGSLARLNSRQGDSAVHWLMEGYEGSEIEPSLAPETHDVMAWRQRLRPGGELLEPLRQRGISKVAVAGLKAGQSVLSVVQALADEGLLVYVPRECVADDDAGRRAAVLEHLLPQFGDVLGFEEFKRSIAEEMMMDAFVETRSMQPPAG